MILPEPIVVDASVAVKWYITESDSPQALALVGSGLRLLAPDLLPAEVGNVLWKRSLRGDLQAEQARAMADDVTSSLVVALIPTNQLLVAAMGIALRYERTVYDSLYLALAVREGCQLVTADERLYNRMQGTELEPYIVTLGRY